MSRARDDHGHDAAPVAEAPGGVALAPRILRALESPTLRPFSALARYACAPAGTLFSALVQYALLPQPALAPFVFFYFSVALVSWLAGRGPGLLAVALSALVANYLFVPPYRELTLTGPALTATALFLVGSTAVSLLCASFRDALFDAQRTAAVLRRQAELLRLSHDAIVVCRFDGAIETWNRGAEELYGFGAGEARGRISHDLLRTRFPCPLPRIESALREQRRWEGELEQWAKDGRAIMVSAKMQLVRGEDGAERILETNRDITERKRAEEALRKADRLKDEFLSMASHELRTPLTTLRIHTEALARSLRKARLGDELVGRKLSSMDAQLGRLDALVKTLLDVSRIVDGRIEMDREEFDLAKLAGEAIERFAYAAERSGTELRLRARAVVGRWDRNRLDQVLTNLIDNAIKYAPGQPVEVSVDEHDGRAQLVVRDHGIGISPESQARIFERFERAAEARSFGGLGLGLWIARQMVEAHGGSISVASSPGAGSTFTVTLPGSAR